jgi:hypothetical protein
MKRFLIIVALLAAAIMSLQAQKTKDALYLRNGSIIYGKLLEISDNRYSIQTSDGSIFNFDSEEVDKFIKETPRYEGRKTSGPGFALEAGLLIGSQSSEFEAPFSFNLIVNYTTSTSNILGLGSGVEFFGSAFTPVFFEYRRLLNTRKTCPFIFIRGGGLLHTGNDEEEDSYNQNYYRKDYRGGTSFAAGTGISWTKDDIETYLSFAYRYAQTSYRQKNYNDILYTYKNNYNRLEVKFGFKF